jgi:hypothetical protein
MKILINFLISQTLKSVMIFAVCILSVQAFAQDSTGSNVKVKDRRATLNFEDELVEGATQKPELFYLFQKKNFNYKRLIKLRENFLPEMRKTTEDLQRVRGVN